MSIPVLVRPHVNELALELYGRPLHPELFDVLSTQRLLRDQQRLTIHITRTGHCLTWDNGRVFLTEVFSMRDEQLAERHRLLRHRLRGEKQCSVHCGHGVEYQMSFQVEPLPPAIFLHVHDEIVADASRGFLYNFQPNNRLSLAPLGFVVLEGRPDCLILHAFHTFPDEHTIVKSQTMIELNK